MRLLEEEWNYRAQSRLISTYPEPDLAPLDNEQVSEQGKLNKTQEAAGRLETKLVEEEWNDRVHRQ